MKTIYLLLFSLIILSEAYGQDILVKDAYSEEPVAFATVSFGDGLGTFANAQGVFRFSEKIYPNIDTLYVSSIGYQELSVAINNLTKEISLIPGASQLATVVVNADLVGKYKTREINEIAHDDYFNCWLPTVESEIAIKIERYEGAPTLISHLKLPIVLEESQRSKKGDIRKFSTLFRVMFYDVEEDGSPSFQSYYPTKTFIINQESDEIFELDITDLKISIPKNGVFAAIQVLGYTKPDGELINAKKYREIKTRTGYTKVSTTYRPLLPFTEKIEGKKTWVRRIFLNGKKWQLFDLDYNPMSKLVRSGHINYGMGAELRVYPEQD
jgi:hypothetical protein